ITSQQQALQEKEILLKEIHHRVRNNLQIMSSLFYLQARRTENLEVRRLLEESRGRVEAIALVHEQLYQSNSPPRIELAPYVRELVAGLMSTYSGAEDGKRIATDVSAPGIYLGTQQAIPCGLLVGELVSNAYRHAFPDGRCGAIRISAQRVGEAEIVVEISD